MNSESTYFELKKWILHTITNGKKKFKPKQDKRHRDAEKAAEDSVRLKVVDLCKTIDNLVTQVLVMKTESENFNKGLENILNKEKNLKEFGFEWRPNLGAYVPPSNEDDNREKLHWICLLYLNNKYQRLTRFI